MKIKKNKRPCNFCGATQKKNGKPITNIGDHEYHCSANPNGVPHIQLTQDERAALAQAEYEENCRVYAENPRLFRKMEIELTDSVSIWVG